MKRVVLLGVACAALAAAAFLIGYGLERSGGEDAGGRGTVSIGGARVSVEVAADEASRVRGLGGRDALRADEGMLFVFPTDAPHGIWMKDMRFSIDIIWIAADRTVAAIAPRVAPETFPTVFSPEMPARYVLEVPAGWVDRHEIDIGDPVEFDL